MTFTMRRNIKPPACHLNKVSQVPDGQWTKSNYSQLKFSLVGSLLYKANSLQICELGTVRASSCKHTEWCSLPSACSQLEGGQLFLSLWLPACLPHALHSRQTNRAQFCEDHRNDTAVYTSTSRLVSLSVCLSTKPPSGYLCVYKSCMFMHVWAKECLRGSFCRPSENRAQ